MSHLVWTDVDDSHKRATPDAFLVYDIIHTSDGLVSWQGPRTDWAYVPSVEVAMAAADLDYSTLNIFPSQDLNP